MKYLALLGIVLFLLYTITALWGHAPDRFYIEGEQVHTFFKVDFYQVPNAAYMFFRGGPLGGDFPTYMPQYPRYFHNIPNPYHPFFTLTTGGILQLFSPEYAYYAWFTFNTILWGTTGYFLYRHMGDTPYRFVGLLFFFGLSPYYINIRNGQYHILVTALIMYLLIHLLYENKSRVRTNTIYILSLLVKPISALYAIPILQAGKGKSIVIGTIAFIVLTSCFIGLSFILNRDTGMYYLVNIIARLNTPLLGPPQAASFDALLRTWDIPFYNTTLVKILIGLTLIATNPPKRWGLFSALFLWTSFFLLFYDFIYEYHYLILAPFFALGVSREDVFKHPAAFAAMSTYLLPTPYVLMKFLHIGAWQYDVTTTTWSIMVLWRVIPLIILCLLAVKRGIPDGSENK